MKIKYIANAFIPLVLTLIILLLQGCGSRKDILNIALTQKDKIPQILLYDPEDGNLNVPLNTRISVVFSKSMDRESVESNFSYSYNDKTYGKNSGYFDWNDDNTGFIFTPSEDFPAYTDVFVTITNDAKSSENINLTNDLTWSFTTSDSDDLTQPHVSSVTPFDGTLVETDQYISISITFNEAMLKGTVENSFYIQSDDGNDFRDNNSGYFMWNGNEVTYYPNEPLNENNLYYIYLDKNGNIPWDLAGNGLTSYTAVSFYTNSDEIFVSLSGDDTSNYGTNRYSPFKTIAKAIDYAKNNARYSVINIDSNSYTESISLDTTDYNGITIRGGWNTDFTFQDGTTTISDSANDFVVTINNCSDITLENIKIDSSTTTNTNQNGAISVDTCQNIVLNNLTLNASTSSGSSTYGLCVDDSSVTVNNCTINGGASTTDKNCGVYLIGSSDQSVIRNSSITGGSAGEIYGIYIDGCSPTIENNQSISAGSTSGNPSYGIYITNSASPVIRDNHFIDGGDNSGDDTFGLWVDKNSTPSIYRCAIIGGSENGGGHYNYGIYYDNASDDTAGGILMNNFIFGGSLNTQNSNECHAIHIVRSNIEILNNTINGLGSNGTGHRYAIYGFHTDSLIINNIIIGGNSTVENYGIYLNDVSSSNTANEPCIFNNVFDKDKCNDYLTDGVNNKGNDIDSNVNNFTYFTCQPEYNVEYTSTDGVTYVNESNYDYHISTDDNNLIKNHGFSSSNSNYSTFNYIYDNTEALYDIDDEPRPSDYSKIDLGADEFAP
ncbi:MAG: hypothetical protein DRP84_05625 [Spirochaetes bacterium]|nr:MAG: hypothetical protein DRP84_05625 [Spirochaetota bacterium]